MQITKRLGLLGLAIVSVSVVVACGSAGGAVPAEAGADKATAPLPGSRDSGGDGTHSGGLGDASQGSKGQRDASQAGGEDAKGGDRTPITGVTTGSWTWVPFADAHCLDGSSTGIGVNLGTSQNLMIFLEGGGACFNLLTCLGTPSSFDAADFAALTATNADLSVNAGILDRTNMANPVKDWSFVYVPYCTGDIDGGNNITTVPEVGGTLHFVGYANMALYLDRVVPTFPSVKQVLITGMSAGGFGAAVNYAQTAKAFGKIPVTMIDDSGPFMEDPSLPVCLQDSVRTLWGLDGTVLSECGGKCNDPKSIFLDYMAQMVESYPSVGFGLADDTNDGVITQFFGFGLNNCATYSGPESASLFTEGMYDIRKQLASYENYGEFFFSGTAHTSIQSAAFYTRTAGGDDGGTGVLMTDWVANVLAGTPTNPGP